MKQSELNRAVARATGEEPGVIARMGFIPLSPRPQSIEERDPLLLDWDAVDVLRNNITASMSYPPLCR